MEFEYIILYINFILGVLDVLELFEIYMFLVKKDDK